MRYLDMIYSIFKILKNAKKAKCDRPTDQQTDRPTDRPTQCLIESRARDKSLFSYGDEPLLWYISIWLTSAVSYNNWFCYFWVISRTCLAVPPSNHLSHLLGRWNSYRLKNRSWRSCTEGIKKFRCCIHEETQKKVESWGEKNLLRTSMTKTFR